MPAKKTAAKKNPSKPDAKPVEIRDRVVGLVRVKASELVPNKKNWHKHPKKQREAIGGALREIGYAAALIARKTSGQKLQLIDGHLRAKTTPDTVVPVLIVDLSEKEADTLLASFDPIGAMAAADESALCELLKSIESKDSSLQAFLDSLKTRHSEVVAIGEDASTSSGSKYKVESGQIWSLGRHRLACGDATDKTLIAKLLGKNRPRLVATDPPYGVDYVAAKAAVPVGGLRDVRSRHFDIANDAIGADGVSALVKNALMAVLDRCDKPAVYVWHAYAMQCEVASAMIDAGVAIHRQIVWGKNSLVMSRGDYHWQHELCYYGWLKGNRCAWTGNRKQTTLWKIEESPGGGLHPTQKPVELFAVSIRNHLRRGEWCFEPFAGSGSQLIAAEQCGACCAAVELSPVYCQRILARWSDMTGDTPTRQR